MENRKQMPAEDYNQEQIRELISKKREMQSDVLNYKLNYSSLDDELNSREIKLLLHEIPKVDVEVSNRLALEVMMLLKKYDLSHSEVDKVLKVALEIDSTYCSNILSEIK